MPGSARAELACFIRRITAARGPQRLHPSGTTALAPASSHWLFRTRCTASRLAGITRSQMRLSITLPSPAMADAPGSNLPGSIRPDIALRWPTTRRCMRGSRSVRRDPTSRTTTGNPGAASIPRAITRQYFPPAVLAGPSGPKARSPDSAASDNISSMLRSLALLILLAATSLFGQRRAAPPATAVTSDTRIAINGGESLTLPQVHGDWFSTPTDAHVSVDLQGTTARLSLQLDGLNATQIINRENNTDAGGSHVSFFWHSPGHDVSPHGSDAITVQVEHLDDRDFEGRLSGTAEGVTFTGSIHLHRDNPPPPKLTGKYGDCDNVIHDKLALAQNRSPSDC